MSSTEYEATFAKVDPKKLIKKLESTGMRLVHDKALMKRKAFHLPTPSTSAWVRVRKEVGKTTLTYKNISEDDVIESQKESEVEVSDFNSAVAILKNIGCKEKAYQENYRETWVTPDGGVVITIDEWPFLEPFVEIEGPDEESVRRTSETLGFDWGSAIFDAVTYLYSQKYSISRERINNQTPKIVFEMDNPFVD